MLKAAALLKAIFISTLVGIFCAILILVSFLTRQQFQYNFDLQELINANQVCVDLLSSGQANNNNFKNKKEILGVFCNAKKRKWGVFDIWSVRTFKRKDTLQKSYILSSLNNLPVLYVPNQEEAIKLAGKVKISGGVQVPNGRMLPSSIFGNQVINQININGEVLKSSKQLPKLAALPFFETHYGEAVKEISLEEFLDLKIAYNSFLNPTYHIIIDGDITLHNLKLKGNIIISVEGDVIIKNTCDFEDLIVRGNSVFFESYFEGMLQVFASKKVIVHKNAKLLFPSTIVVNSLNTESEELGIVVSENSVFEGLLLLKTPKKERSKIIIEREVSFKGLVYSTGILETKSNLKGSIFAQELGLKTTYSEYSNVLLDVNLELLSFGKNKASLSYSIFSQFTTNRQSIIIKEI